MLYYFTNHTNVLYFVAGNETSLTSETQYPSTTAGLTHTSGLTTFSPTPNNTCKYEQFNSYI